jgi:ATP synthase protein I
MIFSMIKRMLQLQIIFSGIFIIIVALTVSMKAMISAIIGCLCCFIPCSYFFWKASKEVKDNNPEKFITQMYYAETGKFLLTISCFILVFKSNILHSPIVFFMGFIVVQSTVWLLSVI